MNSKIKYIQIFGERNSGTNYLKQLLELNLEGVEVVNSYGWKHAYIIYRKFKDAGITDTLFICIFKDPYAWISSMHEKPHHAPQLYFLEFSDFIKRQWICYKGANYQIRAKNLDKDPVRPEEEMVQERHPRTKLNPDNVIMLRNFKNERYIHLGELVEHYMRLQYEHLLFDTEGIIQNIANQHGFKMKDTFTNPSGYFGKNPNLTFNKKLFYEKKSYLNKYSPEDLKFVNETLNWEYEKILGYEEVAALVK